MIRGRPSRTSLALAAILGLALLIRMLHLYAISDTAFSRFPEFFRYSDMNFYWEWAQRIAAGDLLSRDTYHPYTNWMMRIAPADTWLRWWGGKEILHSMPLYPYWVAGLLAVSGGSIRFVLLVQLIVGALQPLVIFWLARRLFDERVGLVAAAICALYGPFILFQGMLLRDWMTLILEPLALLALVRASDDGRARAWCLAGAAMGLALLAKTTMMLFLPLAFGWIVWTQRASVRRSAFAVCAVLAGLLLALAPLFARNAAVGAPLFAFDNRNAENIALGLASDTFPLGLLYPESMKGVMERSEGRFLPAVVETIRTHHGDWRGFLRLELLKARGIIDPLELPDNVSYAYVEELSPVLRVTLRYGILLPLGLAGLVLSLGTWRRHALLLLYGLAGVAGLLIAIVLARFRLVLMPVLAIYAAAGLVYFVDALRERRRMRWAAYLALVALVAGIQHGWAPIRFLRDNPSFELRRQEYDVSANIYVVEGRFDRAVAEVARLHARAQDAAVSRPAFAPLAAWASGQEGAFRVRWARKLLLEGKRSEALQQARLAETNYGVNPLADGPAADLGFLYIDLGEPEKAEPYLRKSLKLAPMGEWASEIRRVLSELDR